MDHVKPLSPHALLGTIRQTRQVQLLLSSATNAALGRGVLLDTHTAFLAHQEHLPPIMVLLGLATAGHAVQAPIQATV